MKTKTYNSGLRALLSIRNLSESLEKNRTALVQIEKEINDLNSDTSVIIQSNCTTDAYEKWKTALKEIDSPAFNVNKTLKTVIEKIAIKDSSGSSDLWKQFDLYLGELNNIYKNLEELGIEILPKTEHEFWKRDIDKFKETILPLIESISDTCRVQLRIIEKYSTNEVTQITDAVLLGIPNDFTPEEAEKYEQDYLVALKDFKQEFHKEKDLWDSFLDILADGSHQTPTENVMMGRWVDGEKGDLK
ncbi:MAG: hypothetical protein ACK4YV_08820 [Emticicia sp.]